ncbi:MAG: recombinase family protein [Oscillospiraceae bacterium]|nr:recombinase family protein [Oscillospiraceae bacterium]
MAQTVQQKRRIHIIPATKPTTAPGHASGQRQRVAAYCRVSTDSEEQLTSYTAQKAYYTQKIDENPDWEMAGIYADKGITGTSMKKRVEFKKMIAACKRGRIDLILTKSLSRFARNTVDSLEVVRMLRANGIGVIFEKENINTLTESSEFLLTLFSGFAQAESESISKNVIWGIQKSREAGNVPFQYQKLLGYRRGPDGQPEIVPEEAEVVKRIYRRYLDGCSLAQIKRELEADGIPTASGIHGWTYQVVRNILTNEKYIGDALLQKTYTTDCISKTVKKNQGDRPMVYVERNHPAIVSKAIFYQVREEMARRGSKRKVMQKTGKTEQGKYSSKYALSELLVCGECGTPYKRCTWARNGKKRIVWRCISRLEFGTKYCHDSPTMDEDKLHQAILEGINELIQAGQGVGDELLDLAGIVQQGINADGIDPLTLRNRLDALTAQQAELLDKVLEDMDNTELTDQLKAIAEEKQAILEQLGAIQQDEEQRAGQEARRRELAEWLNQQRTEFTEYDDTITRKYVERITVVDAETIRIKFRYIEVVIDRAIRK